MTSSLNCPSPHRILVVDDNADVLNDFRKVLCPRDESCALEALEEDLFGTPKSRSQARRYDATFAESGELALEAVRRAHTMQRPYTLAFVDMRMPGWNGVQTIQQLWRVQSNLEVAICSAYMDYSWNEVISQLKRPGLRLLRKPWTSGEVLAVVHELIARSASRAALA